MMGCRSVCLLLLAILAGTYAQPRCMLITPNVLRLDTEENIVVDGQNLEFDADVEIMDFPQRKFSLAKKNVSINSSNQYLSTAVLKIPSIDLLKDQSTKHFVYVMVKSPVCNLEKVILVGYQSRYIFIQTDKTIYTRGSTVFYRIFLMDYKMSPVNKTVVVEFLTPENIIVKRDTIKQDSSSGIISLQYSLPERLSLGTWTIEAKYEDFPLQNYLAHFEVKQYVLPAFEIQLIPKQKYFYIDDEEFEVDVKAKYNLAKDVEGSAFVLFGVMKDGVKTRFANTIRMIWIERGDGTATLRRKDFLKNLKNVDDMLQYSLYMSITVITDSGSEMVDTELENIHIVKSPYNVFFSKIPKYFKPGMPFYLTAFVTNPDGSPANRINVVAEPGNMKGLTGPEGTVQLVLNTAANINNLTINVKTSQGLSAEREASVSMTVIAYNSDGNYLHIGITTSKVKPGDNLAVNFNIRNTNATVQNQIQHFTYVIMNKGRVMKVDRQQRLPGQALVSMSLPITEAFIPSFRIIAYYIAENDIVSDSIRVDVADTCMGTLEVTGKSEQENRVQSPGSSIMLQLKADYKARVGLVAVDKGVSELNSKHKMSQSKVWGSVEKADIGCTPGTGADNMRVFYDAGLAVQSSMNATTVQRSEHLCETPLPWTQSSIAQLMELQNSCGAPEDCIRGSGFMSRTHFPESWFWKIETMNEKPDMHGISTKMLNMTLKDSITTWEVLAVSLSENKGLCVAKPYEIKVVKDFMIDLKLPFSVVRNEQVEIRAILYNNRNDKMKVQVEFTHNPEFNSLSNSRGNFRVNRNIYPRSAVAVPFIIVPLSLGLHNVEVKATVFQRNLPDVVRKMLNVVSEGVRLAKTVTAVTLEPHMKGQDGVQKEVIPPLDEKNIVPQTDIETIIRVQGTPTSQMVEDAINGPSLTPLIVVPQGSEEDNMITMTPSVIATSYLDATSQWEKVGLNRREKAIMNIKTGYVQQLFYRKADGSYVTFKGRPASTWLTAYVAKVFAMARPLIDIEAHVICDSIKWLTMKKQEPNGLFKKDAPVIQQEMIGGINGSKQPDVTLTAFVLIALLESEATCTPHVTNLNISIENAARFLLGQYPNLHKPYSVAIASYALAMAGSINSSAKLMSVATDKSHWAEPDARFTSLEGTAYALLALLRIKEYELTGPIVRWLIEKRYYGAVYGSTQATVVMFQALAQYQIDNPHTTTLDLNVSIHLPGRLKPLQYNINADNALLVHTVTTRMNKQFEVTAKGKGQASLTVMSVYHAIVTEKEQQCKNFDLAVKVEEVEHERRPEGATSTISLEICARHLKDQDATMSIIDISMMTGFSPDIDSLNTLSTGMNSYISKYEINKEATERSTLLLYLDKISHKQQECVKFYAHQIFRVNLIQPASVTVYDYYAPESRCIKLYHFEEDRKILDKICQQDECHCAESNCFLQQQLEGQLTAQERMQRACGSNMDYVYKARMDNVESNGNYENYVMTIVTIIKQGTDKIVEGKQRNFVSHIKCCKSLDLKKGREYLIWGVKKDLWAQPTGYSYIIGKDTWIEWWPNNTECQDPENEDICDIFLLLSENLELNGCES